MKTPVEVALHTVVLGALCLAVIQEGRTHAALEEQVAVAPKDLYRLLGRANVKLQVVDVRPASDDGFEDTHVPGALPFPDCSPGTTAPAAMERIIPSVPTVMVGQSGDVPAACKGHFKHARVLAGGMDAWSSANLPEDSGEYVPPKAAAGGGCL